MLDWFVDCCIARSIARLSVWLFECQPFFDCLIVWLVGWLIDWLVARLTCSVDSLLIGCLNCCSCFIGIVWLVSWLGAFFSSFFWFPGWSIACLLVWLNAWLLVRLRWFVYVLFGGLIACLIGLLSDWLLGWVVDCGRARLVIEWILVRFTCWLNVWLSDSFVVLTCWLIWLTSCVLVYLIGYFVDWVFID